MAIWDRGGDGAQSELVGGLDRLAALPTQAAAMEAARDCVTAWTTELRAMAEKASLPEGLDLNEPWAVYFTQRATPRPDAHLTIDAPAKHRHPGSTAVEFLEQCRLRGIRPVIKPHPYDMGAKTDMWGPTRTVYPEALILPYKVSDGLCARLMLDAPAGSVLVNSSLVFTALALDAPLLQLGCGWASDNDVVTEGRIGLLTGDPAPLRRDPERRRAFLALVASRCRPIPALRDEPQEAVRLLRFFAALNREETATGASKAVSAAAKGKTPLSVPKAVRAAEKMVSGNSHPIAATRRPKIKS